MVNNNHLQDKVTMIIVTKTVVIIKKKRSGYRHVFRSYNYRILFVMLSTDIKKSLISKK